jgi:hypothetical protein
MANFCPTGPEWSALEKELGKGDATTALLLNGNAGMSNPIPTVDEAKAILRNLSAEDKDEQLVKSSESYKLIKAREELARYQNAMIVATPDQQETLKNLMKLAETRIAFHKGNVERIARGEEPIKTLSVSTLMGSSEFNGDPSKYEAFKLFGTFMHEVIEKAQILANLGNRAVNETYDREFFDKVYDSFQKKSEFEISGLTPDMLYVLSKQLIDQISHYKAQGCIILPEVTVSGYTSYANMVIGRIDMMVVDPFGKIKILDFKTKKLHSIIDVDATGKRFVNPDRVYLELADESKEITAKPGTHSSFAKGKRSAYDTWALQLQIYNNLLESGGMSVDNHSIISLVYQTNDAQEFMGASTLVFNDDNFYNYAGVAVVPNGAGFVKVDPVAKKKKIDGLRAVVDEIIPTGKEEEEKEEKKAKQDFIPTKSQNQKLREKVQSVLDSELKDLGKQINLLSKNDANNPILKVLKQHRETLMKLRTRFQNMSDEDRQYSYNFSLTMDFVMQELANFEKDSMEDMELIRNTDTENLTQTNSVLKAMTARFQKSRTAAAIVDALSEIVSEARRNKSNGITEGSEVYEKLETLRSMIAGVEADFREASLKCAIKIFRSPGEENFKGVKKDMENAMRPKLKLLRKQLEDLKAGKYAGLWNAVKAKTFSFLSKEYKEKLAQKMGPDGAGILNAIESKEREIMKVEAILQHGITYDDASMAAYMNALTDPKAIGPFIGHSDVYNPSAIMSGFGAMLVDPGSLIAGASSSELGVASHVIFMKNASAQAVRNAQEDFVTLDFDKRMERMLKRFSNEQLNDAISEWRTVSYRDKDGNLQEKQELYIVKPYSEGYEQTYLEHNDKLRGYSKEISELEEKVYSSFGKPEHEGLKNDLIAKRSERDLYKSQHIQWMIDNCSLPYSEDFYKLQQMLPEEIREPLQKLYLEMEILQHTSGAENRSSVMDADDFDRMQEIQIEIRKLRNKAKELNPKYAEYMDKFNELYDYEEDEASYKRAYDAALAKYSGTPQMEEWLKQNEIMVPTEQWYEKLNELYEERAALYGADEDSDAISELMERRREILRPHKPGGKFTSKYMTAEEVSELDSIYNSLDQIFAEKETSGKGKMLTGAAKDRAREIRNEINRLSQTKISSSYTETFNMMTKMLNARKSELTSAENNEIRLKGISSGATKEDLDKAEQARIAASEAFARYETEYKEWYNKNHTNKYESILTGFDPHTKVVKPFNYERVPSGEAEAEYLKPKHPKFTKRVLKESAKNPNYHLSADNIPMPKGIDKDAEGNIEINHSLVDKKNVNDKYMQVMADPELGEFYTALTKMHFSLQKRIEGNPVGYKVPGYAASSVENLARKGILGSIDSEVKKFIDANLNVHGEQDLASNVFGDAGQVIRMGHSHQLSKDLQTQDAIGAVMKYAMEAHYNIAMQEVAPMSEAYIQLLELKAEDLKKEIQKGKTTFTDDKGNVVEIDMSKRLADLQNVIEQCKFERDKYIYGQTEFSNSEASRKVKKFVNSMFKYTSFIRLSFDMAAQTKNYFSGNIQAFIAAGGSNSDHYTTQDFAWAKGKMYGYDGFLANYFKDWGKISDISDSTMLYRMMNPAQKDFSHYLDDITAGRTRRMAGKLLNFQEIGYMLQENGDTEIAVTVMYSVMKHYKYEKISKVNPDGSVEFELDAQGNPVMVSAVDAYYKDSKGMLVRRPDVNYKQSDEDRLRNIIYSEMRRTQGNYAKADMTRFERGVTGKLVYFYRKYLVPQMLNRFGYMRPNYEAGDVAMGYWRAVYAAWKYYGTANTLKSFVLGGKLATKFGSQVDMHDVVDPNTQQVIGTEKGDFYTKKIDQARRDAIAMAIVSMMGMMLLAAVRQRGDDEPIGVIEGNMMRVLWGVKGETLAMFPIGGGSDEYIRNFTTISVYTREVQAAGRFASHAYSLGRAKLAGLDEMPDRDEDPYNYEIYKGAYYTRKSGFYEQGDAKLMKDFADFSGMRNFRNLFDPSQMVQQTKRQQ